MLTAARAGHPLALPQVRSYQGSWGFVTSDLFPGDLFIHQDAIPRGTHLEPGMTVQLEIREDSKGRLNGVDITADSGGGQYPAV